MIGYSQYAVSDQFRVINFELTVCMCIYVHNSVALSLEPSCAETICLRVMENAKLKLRSRDRLVSILTKLRCSIPGAHQASISMCIAILPVGGKTAGAWSCWLQISGAIPLLPLYIFKVSTRTMCKLCATPWRPKARLRNCRGTVTYKPLYISFKQTPTFSFPSRHIYTRTQKWDWKRS